MRRPGPHTLCPDVVLIASTGKEIPVRGDPIMEALVATIAEDFMHPTRGGAPDVISAAADAQITLEIIKFAGLKLVDAE